MLSKSCIVGRRFAFGARTASLQISKISRSQQSRQMSIIATIMQRFSKSDDKNEPAKPEKYIPIRINEGGDKVVFHSDTHFQIRVMGVVGAVNTVYWVYHLANCLLFEDVVVQGVSLGGNPWFSAFGLGVSGILFFTTHVYAKHAICRAYVSADGYRLGFQMYNVFGNPGRVVEATAQNVKIKAGEELKSGMTRLEVKGLEKYALLDSSGHYYDNGILKTILHSHQIPKYLAGDKELVEEHVGNYGNQVVASGAVVDDILNSPAPSATAVPPPPPPITTKISRKNRNKKH